MAETSDGVVGVLASGSPLAAIIEHGASIPAFDIVPSAAKAMHFDGDAGQVFAKMVHFPGARLPPRPILHTALEALSGQIVEEFQSLGLRFTEDAS